MIATLQSASDKTGQTKNKTRLPGTSATAVTQRPDRDLTVLLGALGLFIVLG